MTVPFTICCDCAKAAREKRPASPSLCGPAFTVKVPEGDNLMLHKAMDLAEPGDVLVVDAGGDPHRAVFGDLIVTYCRKRGIAGIVVDGAIRDRKTIGALTDFPVYATGVCPNGPWKNGPGEIGFPVTCGGVIVRPGDIIVGDLDGVIVVPLAEADAVAAATDKILANEEKIVAEITGKGTYTRPWVETKLAALGCEYDEI